MLTATWLAPFPAQCPTVSLWFRCSFDTKLTCSFPARAPPSFQLLFCPLLAQRIRSTPPLHASSHTPHPHLQRRRALPAAGVPHFHGRVHTSSDEAPGFCELHAAHRLGVALGDREGERGNRGVGVRGTGRLRGGWE